MVRWNKLVDDRRQPVTMRNWKTSVCGLVGLAGGLLAQFYPEHARLGGFLAALGNSAGLMFAADGSAAAGDGGKPPGVSVPIGVKLFLAAGLVGLVLSLAGCARFRSVMTATKPDGTVIESRQSVVTFLDASSSVAKLRASTTDKTQGLTVGGLNEESSSSALTNAATIFEAIGRGVVQGLK